MSGPGGASFHVNRVLEVLPDSFEIEGAGGHIREIVANNEGVGLLPRHQSQARLCRKCQGFFMLLGSSLVAWLGTDLINEKIDEGSRDVAIILVLARGLISLLLFIFGVKLLLSGSFRQRLYALVWVKVAIAFVFLPVFGAVPAGICDEKSTSEILHAALTMLAAQTFVLVPMLMVFMVMLCCLPCITAHPSQRAVGRRGNMEQCFCKCGWTAYINEAQIRWVQAGTFRRWSREGVAIPRAQELLEQDFVVGGSSSGRLIISHVWRSPYHPDPYCHGLRELVAEFDRLKVMDEELVFYDYCSLFQDDKQHPDWQRFGHRPPHGHPRNYLRTPEQNVLFCKALSKMHLLYSRGFGRVLVMPQAPDDIPRYADRGWCFFELMACTSSGRIANADNADVTKLLEETFMPLGLVGFLRAFPSKHFTGRGDARLVRRLYLRMWLERVGLQGIAIALCIRAFMFVMSIIEIYPALRHPAFLLIFAVLVFLLVIILAISV